MKKINIAMLFCFLLFALKVPATSPIPAPTKEDLAQVWIGGTSDIAYLWRLDLAISGGGYAAFIYNNDSAKLFKVEKWTLAEKDIVIILEPMESGEDRMVLKGTAVKGAMLVEFGPANGKWRRAITMHNEALLKPRYEKVKQRMEDAAR